MKKKKFSVSSIILIVLICLRILGQISASIYSVYINSYTVLYLIAMLIFTLVYLITFIGLIKKKRWAVITALSISIIDAVLTTLLNTKSVIVGALVANAIIAISSLVILTRNNKKLY